MSSSKWQAKYRILENEALEQYFTFLRMPSISADPLYQKDSQKCALWLQDFLYEIGFRTELWETTGNPVVFGCSEQFSGRPTLLLYHHYDVQPTDPLELWDSPPFEPEIRNGNVYARGAQDNKGQCLYTLMALKALFAEYGGYPINIKLCIEGEEEIGSPSLTSLLEKKKKELNADFLAIIDSGMQRKDFPEVGLGARGIVTMDIEAIGSAHDLHSGQHGGMAYNPNRAMAEVLAKLHHPESGKVLIPGFYDGIKELSEAEKSLFDFTFDEQQYEEDFGAKPTGGEQLYSPMERGTIRPALEINGISGGYAGKGFKTVIPCRSTAKLSCRLVPDQDPNAIGKLIADHIYSLAPKGIEMRVGIHSGSGKAVRAPANSAVATAFTKAYEELYGIPARVNLMGGSIPVAARLVEACGAKLALAGMALPTDSIHAPNEHFSLDRLEKGFCLVARMIEILSRIE